jgi:hypothetical protein
VHTIELIALMSAVDDRGNFETFRDCLCGSIIAKLSSSKVQKSDKRSRRKRKSVQRDDIGCAVDDDVETGDLSEFAEVCLHDPATNNVHVLNPAVSSGRNLLFVAR